MVDEQYTYCKVGYQFQPYSTYIYDTILSKICIFRKLLLQILRRFSCNFDCIYGFIRGKNIGIGTSFVVNGRQEILAYQNLPHVFAKIWNLAQYHVNIYHMDENSDHFSVYIHLLHHYESNFAQLSVFYSLVIGLQKSQR